MTKVRGFRSRSHARADIIAADKAALSESVGMLAAFLSGGGEASPQATTFMGRKATTSVAAPE
jgi:hypothetical protein